MASARQKRNYNRQRKFYRGYKWAARFAKFGCLFLFLALLTGVVGQIEFAAPLFTLSAIMGVLSFVFYIWMVVFRPRRT
jgi:hypothetical protein